MDDIHCFGGSESVTEKLEFGIFGTALYCIALGCMLWHRIEKGVGIVWHCLLYFLSKRASERHWIRSSLAFLFSSFTWPFYTWVAH